MTPKGRNRVARTSLEPVQPESRRDRPLAFCRSAHHIRDQGDGTLELKNP